MHMNHTNSSSNITTNASSPFPDDYKYLNSWWLSPLAMLAIFVTGLLLFCVGRCVRDCVEELCCDDEYLRNTGRHNNNKSAPFRNNDLDYIAYPGEHFPADDDQSMRSGSLDARPSASKGRGGGGDSQQHRGGAQKGGGHFTNPVDSGVEDSETPRWDVDDHDHHGGISSRRPRAHSTAESEGAGQNYSLYDDEED